MERSDYYVSPEWRDGPFEASHPKLRPSLTPFHPAIEIAIYARLLHELGEVAAGRDLIAAVHHQLLMMVNSTYDDHEWG